jgi:hypothetical protein
MTLGSHCQVIAKVFCNWAAPVDEPSSFERRTLYNTNALQVTLSCCRLSFKPGFLFRDFRSFRGSLISPTPRTYTITAKVSKAAKRKTGVSRSGISNWLAGAGVRGESRRCRKPHHPRDSHDMMARRRYVNEACSCVVASILPQA